MASIARKLPVLPAARLAAHHCPRRCSSRLSLPRPLHSSRTSLRSPPPSRVPPPPPRVFHSARLASPSQLSPPSRRSPPLRGDGSWRRAQRRAAEGRGAVGGGGVGSRGAGAARGGGRGPAAAAAGAAAPHHHEGVDLSDVAAEHSLCASREKGGMVGWITRGTTEPEFEEAAFKAKPGDVVRCKTKHGWHLLQVLGDRHAAVLDQVTVEEFARRLQEQYVLAAPHEGSAEGEGRSLEAELAEAEAESGGRRAVQLVDVREPREVELAAIPGFTVLPLSQFGQWGPTVADTLDPHTDTYLLCHHGIRSQQMAEWLKSQGFTRLYNIAGGIDAYSLRVDPSIPRY
ncbi:hypothetical protein CLOP_g22294 [Closterium sp. NIES-67]|nr:hypothetical protein CLOP_g22294 [Closterium sp. NIES-67]